MSLRVRSLPQRFGTQSANPVVRVGVAENFAKALAHIATKTSNQNKEFWAHCKRISGMFKSPKPLHPDDGQRLWEEFSTVCEEAKRNQQKDFEERRSKSKQHRSDILHQAESARPPTTLPGPNPFAPADVDEMKALGAALRKASRMLSDMREQMFGEDKQECFERIKEIRSLHDRWWEERKRHGARKRADFQRRVRANLERNLTCFTSSNVAVTTNALNRTRGAPTTGGAGTVSTVRAIRRLGRFLREEHERWGSLSDRLHGAT